MAEKNEVKHLICLDSLNIRHTASGNHYTVLAGTKFELVPSADFIFVDIDCHFICDVEAEKSSLLEALKKAFKDQHFVVNVEQAEVPDNLPSGQKRVDINISIIGESHVTYQDVFDAVSEHLGSGYIPYTSHVTNFIGDVTEVDFPKQLTLPKGSVFHTYQPGSTLSYIMEKKATFSPTSDPSVYSLTKGVELKDTTKSIALRLTCCFEITDHDHSKLNADNINRQIQQYLQEYQPFDSFVSVFTLKYENWHHSYPYSPRTTGPFSVQLSVLIRNIPKINNQDIAVFFQEYLGYHYIVTR